MTATQEFVLATTAAINGLTIPIASGAYKLSLQVNWSTDSNTAGITVGISFPAARRAIFMVAAQPATVTPVLAVVSVTGQGSGVGFDLFAVTSGTANARISTVEGNLIATGSGNLLLFARTKVQSASCRVLDGSNIVVWKIGSTGV